MLAADIVKLSPAIALSVVQKVLSTVQVLLVLELRSPRIVWWPLHPSPPASGTDW